MHCAYISHEWEWMKKRKKKKNTATMVNKEKKKKKKTKQQEWYLFWNGSVCWTKHSKEEHLRAKNVRNCCCSLIFFISLRFVPNFCYLKQRKLSLKGVQCIRHNKPQKLVLNIFKCLQNILFASYVWFLYECVASDEHWFCFEANHIWSNNENHFLRTSSSITD